jgi:hypothetical protein
MLVIFVLHAVDIVLRVAGVTLTGRDVLEIGLVGHVLTLHYVVGFCV